MRENEAKKWDEIDKKIAKCTPRHYNKEYGCERRRS